MITIKITRKDSTKLQSLLFLIASKTKPTGKEIKFAQDLHAKIHKIQLNEKDNYEHYNKI